MKKLAVFIILVFFSGCDRVEISRDDTGKILDSSPMTTSFNELQKTAVRTEKMNLVILGLPVIPIGVNGYVVRYRRGGDEFTWVGAKETHSICR